MTREEEIPANIIASFTQRVSKQQNGNDKGGKGAHDLSKIKQLCEFETFFLFA